MPVHEGACCELRKVKGILGACIASKLPFVLGLGVCAPPDICSKRLERQRQAVLRLAVLLRHDAEVQVGPVEGHLQGSSAVSRNVSSGQR